MVNEDDYFYKVSGNYSDFLTDLKLEHLIPRFTKVRDEHKLLNELLRTTLFSVHQDETYTVSAFLDEQRNELQNHESRFQELADRFIPYFNKTFLLNDKDYCQIEFITDLSEDGLYFDSSWTKTLSQEHPHIKELLLAPEVVDDLIKGEIIERMKRNIINWKNQLKGEIYFQE